MLFIPIAPGSVYRGDFGEPSVEVFSLDAFQSLPEGIPEGFRFPVIEHKGIIICPS